MLAPVLLLALALAQREEPVKPGDGRIALPAGPVAELIDALPDDARARPGLAGAAWPAWDARETDGWGAEAPWRRWMELVRAERDASAPARRAELAVLARLQGRDADAWAHLRACAAEPERVRTLLPLFVPGVPQELLGHDGPLPDGVLLAPALPPTLDPTAGLRGLAGKRIELAELHVGDARLALRLSVDRDGLEVAVEHLAGGPARVRILPPLPRGIEPGLLFQDWVKRPEHAGPLEFALSAEDPEHSLWLTFHPLEERWPSPRPETLERAAATRELVIWTPQGDEPHLRLCAETLGELLGVPSALRGAGWRPSAPGLEPLVVHLGATRADERKLVALLGLTEAWLLAGDGR
jgi:hypothetical protein